MDLALLAVRRGRNNGGESISESVRSRTSCLVEVVTFVAPGVGRSYVIRGEVQRAHIVLRKMLPLANSAA